MTRPPVRLVAPGETAEPDPLAAYRAAEAETHRFARAVADETNEKLEDAVRRCAEALAERQIITRLSPAEYDLYQKAARLADDVARLRATGNGRVR